MYGKTVLVQWKGETFLGEVVTRGLACQDDVFLLRVGIKLLNNLGIASSGNKSSQHSPD